MIGVLAADTTLPYYLGKARATREGFREAGGLFLSVCINSVPVYNSIVFMNFKE